ncbi:putative ABC transporter permease [Paenibacillus tengchongensis]|uniref:putative ABC transporter permease n=1 Tax=Paenibacillus tengchongensis TaxID=2608684 RepID=UPI001FE2974E|nr:putative ABC transporter permease [Paenibacillus tengchongensis]
MMLTPAVSTGSPAIIMVAGEYFFYFMLYSVLGWGLEGAYNRYTAGTFHKEGFLKGPYKPMYGFAPLLLLLARDLHLPWPFMLVLALVIPSAVEYASGWLLKTAFHRRWWDYSQLPYQLGGHICLKFSLYWWLLSIATLYGLQPLAEWFYSRIVPLWQLAAPWAALVIASDLLWTCWVRRRGIKIWDLGES